MARKLTDSQRAAHRRGQEHAQEILQQTKANRKWAKLLESKDERIQLDALKFLTERAYGKAVQPNTHANADDQPFKIIYESE